MSALQIPSFGQLLSPFISRVPPPAMPRFLALLERGAADRYRYWADVLPDHADVLLICAVSEDEIAARVEAIFPLDDSMRDALHEPLPEARDTYYSVFASLDVWDQLRVQANAERQGAQAWRNIAGAQTDAHVIAELAACSALEEASADRLDLLIATFGSTES
jgi:hypothetical protein